MRMDASQAEQMAIVREAKDAAALASEAAQRAATAAERQATAAERANISATIALAIAIASIVTTTLGIFCNAFPQWMGRQNDSRRPFRYPVVASTPGKRMAMMY